MDENRKEWLIKRLTNLQRKMNVLTRSGQQDYEALEAAKDVIAEIMNQEEQTQENGLMKLQLENWVYRYIPFSKIDWLAIEKALGFRLFFWQKTYIEFGHYRRTGRTTAIILRELLRVDDVPIDATHLNARSPRQHFEGQMLVDIYFKLKNAGILTRTVFICKKDIEEYEKEHGRFYEKQDYIPDIDN